jgi:hypothetical protein
MLRRSMTDESSNIPQMRETIDRLNKEKAGLQKDNGELQSKVRVFEAKDAFRGAGYNPNHGELFAAMNPEGEITPDAVAEFAERQSLPPLSGDTGDSSEEGDSTSDDAGDSNLAGMAGSGSRGGDGGAGGANVESMTRQEWQALHADDPAAAAQAIASGRVEISKDNPYVSGSGLARGENPYATFGVKPE